MPVQNLATAFQNAVANIIDGAREDGIPLEEVCREAGVSRVTLWRWSKKAPDQVEMIDRLRKSLRRARRRRGKADADD